MVETPSNAPLAAVERDLAELETRVAMLVAHAHELRATNETLRRELAASFERHRVLTDKVTEATQRVDELLERLPESAP